MHSLHAIETRREDITQELLTIRSMLKGTVNEQFFPVVRDGKQTDELRGPYAVHSCKIDGKTVSRRLKGKAALQQAREGTANYRRFRALCDEFEGLTEQLGQLEREAGASEEALKKGLKSPSSNTRK